MSNTHQEVIVQATFAGSVDLKSKQSSRRLLVVFIVVS
jgi:hypothetical protein